MFQQSPLTHNASAWAQHAAYPQPAQTHKKLELPTLSVAAGPVPVAAAFSTPVQAVFDLPPCPSHIERFTSFYSSANPALITKALRLGFQQVTELRVDFTEEAKQAKVSEDANAQHAIDAA